MSSSWILDLGVGRRHCGKVHFPNRRAIAMTANRRTGDSMCTSARWFNRVVHQAPLPCRTCVCTALVPLLAIRSIFLASHTAACYLPSGSPCVFSNTGTHKSTSCTPALTVQRSLPARVTVLRRNPLYCWGKCGGQMKVLTQHP